MLRVEGISEESWLRSWSSTAEVGDVDIPTGHAAKARAGDSSSRIPNTSITISPL